MEDAGKSAKHDDLGGEDYMKTNVFDQGNNGAGRNIFLNHDQLKSILTDAKRHGSLKESFSTC